MSLTYLEITHLYIPNHWSELSLKNFADFGSTLVGDGSRSSLSVTFAFPSRKVEK